MVSHMGQVSQDVSIQCLLMGTKGEKDKAEGGWKCPAGR